MCAVELIMNVPSFTSPHSPASPVSLPLYNLDSIENPHMPDREQWLYSLLGAQFTKSEMQSNYAYNFLQDEKMSTRLFQSLSRATKKTEPWEYFVFGLMFITTTNRRD